MLLQMRYPVTPNPSNFQVLDLRENRGIKWEASGAALAALRSPRLRLALLGSHYPDYGKVTDVPTNAS